MNTYSLCIFLFLNKPVITRTSKSFGDSQFKNLMNKRKTNIADLIIKWIDDRWWLNSKVNIMKENYAVYKKSAREIVYELIMN